MSVADSVTAVVRRHRVDRDTVGEREWLAHLDDCLYWLIGVVEEMVRGRRADVDELRRALDEQGEELRRHTLAVTQQGWQYILGGGTLSAFGTLLSQF